MLRIPDMNKKFILESDASNYGLGAVLIQDDIPVAYLSKVFNKAETRYSITEKETLASLWAMEKLRFYLMGNKFTLITDHKAIEYLKSKIEFGSARIQRWFSRLEMFDFDIKYRKRSEMVSSEALSRALFLTNEEFPHDEILNMIRKHTKKFNHRKSIKHDLKNKGIIVSNKHIKEAIRDCMICLKKDSKFSRRGKFIQTSYSGEKVAFDILEVRQKDYIILGIDYFSRKIFGKSLKTKNSIEILNFIKNVNSEFPIKTLIADNGSEFANFKLKKWCVQKSIKLNYSIPYYHRSNGRIERANRTIRNTLKHTIGSTRKILDSILSNYNNSVYRGIGMAPNQASLHENHIKIIKFQIKYSKEFKIRNKKDGKIKINERVLIKNEIKRTKMDDEYK
ncbi:Retrovirus-related Pol polyprotein from transposon 17.6 [Dictyocoela muelleri]|nr:Retrovirus-related Pol polyprotein from transposon 17.6 [Dictyocoela muelleri]